MYRVSDDVIAEIVGLAVYHAAFYPAASHPDCKALGMVVAPVIFLGQLALAINRPPKLAAPDDQRFVQQAALLEVLDQGGGRLVNVPCLVRQVFGQVAVLIPTAMKDLGQPYTALHQTPCEDTAIREGSRLACIRTIHIKDIVRLL